MSAASPEQKFIPKPGQTDFTNIRYCPVINCVVKFGEKILIVERSKGMKLYPEHWNGISGFLDDAQDFKEKILEELGEELGLTKENILSVTLAEIFQQDAPDIKKTWIVHPVLVEVNTDQVRLDWEAQKFQWILPEETKQHKLLPGFDTVLKHVTKLFH